MTKLWLKDCPRCQGDRYLDDGVECCEIVCIQCGYRTDQRPVASALTFTMGGGPRLRPLTAATRRKGRLAA